MSESVQIILSIILLIGLYTLTRYGMVWRMKRAGVFVLKDLERRGAVDPESAVKLPYAKSSFFKIGMRDFRPKALEAFVQSGIVGNTENGNYFLRKTPEELQSILNV
jgi:hypothetical protein